MPWVHLAKAWPGASARAMATASRPRSEAAAAACGSPHQGLLTRYWQVRASPTSASTLRGSRASTARNHCWAWALSSARNSPLRVALARVRYSLTPSSASAATAARRLASCSSSTCSSREIRRVILVWIGARSSGRNSCRPAHRYSVVAASVIRMLTRNRPGLLRWALPVTTYSKPRSASPAGLPKSRRSSAIGLSDSPRPWRNRSVTRSSVKASTRYCCSGSPVRLRSGATATPMLDNRQGQLSGAAGSQAVGQAKPPAAKPATLGRATARLALGGAAGARHLVGQRLGLGIGGNPELALEGLGAALVLAQ